MSLRQILGKIGLGVAVFIIVSPAILFFLWMLSLSVKFEIDNAAYPPILIPDRFAWENYAQVLTSNRFITYFFNSLIVTGSGDAVRAAGRRAGRLRHRPHAGAQVRDRDPDRAHHARPLLSDSAVPAVPVARPARHAVAADHHPSGGHGADRDLDHDRLFRDDAAGAGGGGADRRRHALAGVPPRGAADRPARHRGRVHPGGDLLLEQFRVRHRAGRARDAHAARSRSTT